MRCSLFAEPAAASLDNGGRPAHSAVSGASGFHGPRKPGHGADKGQPGRFLLSRRAQAQSPNVGNSDQPQHRRRAGRAKAVIACSVAGCEQCRRRTGTLQPRRPRKHTCPSLPSMAHRSGIGWTTKPGGPVAFRKSETAPKHEATLPARCDFESRIQIPSHRLLFMGERRNERSATC